MNITGNTIFIPGATSGIGLGLALGFRDRGNTVIVGGRRTSLLDEITAHHPDVDTVEVDVGDAASLTKARDEVVARHPGLNVLVPMAGIMLPEDLRDPAHLETAERTVATNLLGTIRTISAFVPHLVDQSNAAILTVSSGLAFVPLPVTPTYNATKAAIHSYSESLRVQLANSVQVIELVPPGVRTTLMGQQDSEQAMPLEEYLEETFALLEAEPTAQEILVERVKFLRDAEQEGRYAEVLGMLSGH